MKKLFPVVLLILGIFVAIGVFFLMKNKNAKAPEGLDTDTEESVAEVSLDKRPLVSLTPTSDGHYLKLEIKKILIDAATLDYELTYKVPDGRTQGVPGTVKLTTKDDITKQLLLGSESSGKFRYDEGVETGQLVMRFRDANGKLLAKFSTDFNLVAPGKDIISPDSVFKLTLNKPATKTYFVVMDTIGYPSSEKFSDSAKFYGLFSSDDKKYAGNVEIAGSLKVQYWDGSAWSGEFESVGSGVFTSVM
jgi:hypothetical protein